MMPIRFTAIDRVTHDEDRLREARFWATRSIAERVIAGWALAENNLIPREEHEPEKRTGIVLRRILAAGVEYAVLGGVAVSAHGFVRNTAISTSFSDLLWRTSRLYIAHL